MNALQNFFLVCSGANKAILNRTPTEMNRYVGIGATIFFTGLFAMIASSYAIYTVFDSYPIAIAFGLLWGLMIFNLDRYIVSTMKRKGKFFRDFGMAFPRLALAVLIAVVIAKPLELKIFESEIDAEIALMQQENKKAQEDLVMSRYVDAITKQESDIANLKSEIQVKTDVRDRLANEAIIEADGTGGTQQRNMGPIYAIKKQEADNADAELQALIAQSTPLIEAKQEDLAALNERMNQDMISLENATLSGFAARLEALDRLSDKSQIIYLASIFIMLLFIAIETAPIFVKLISERRPYDYVLDKHEFKYVMNHKSITELLRERTQNALDFETKTGRYKTNLAIEAEKEISRQALQEHLESIKTEPLVWKDLLKKGKLFQLD